jgi:myo-inositol 2-dehydrogenase/D-chiro-inositol 1-dehydrogenase
MQIMGDHWRIEVENVHKVRYYRDPVLKGEHPDAVLDNTSDSLVWEPNFTAAEPEDIKGYHLMFGDFFALLDGKPSRIARAEDGAAAMRVLDAISRSWHTRRPIIL